MPPTTNPEFFVFLKNLTAKEVTLSAIPEGTVVFPKVPLIRVEGPLAGMYVCVYGHFKEFPELKFHSIKFIA